MKWTDRLRLTWNAFKRELLPLYLWLILLLIGALILTIVTLGALLGNLISPFLFNDSAIFTDATAMVSLLLASPSTIIIAVLSLAIIWWLAISAINTGLYNLTRKAMQEKVRFKDFQFTGLKRLLAWEAILVFTFTILTLTGLALLFYEHVVIFFIYLLAIVAVLLITLPWWSVAGFYLLKQQEQSFKQALRTSWAFYRRHMGALWGLTLITVVIQLILAGIYEVSGVFGGLLNLFVMPFVAVMPIVWVLSLDRTESNLEEDAVPLEIRELETNAPGVPSPLSESNESVTASQDLPCPTCGRPVKLGTNYCPQCGSKL